MLYLDRPPKDLDLLQLILKAIFVPDRCKENGHDPTVQVVSYQQLVGLSVTVSWEGKP